MALAGPVLAQEAAYRGPSKDRALRRLFQAFVEDAAVVPGGWVEGRYDYQNLEAGSRHQVGPLIAFKVVDNIEAGLRFGFARLTSDVGPDGSGLSDIDLFLKYRLPGRGSTRVALGALVKAPIADETEGLGTGEPDAELFAALRADLEAVSLVLNAGVRYNGEPEASPVDTRHSLLAGAGLLLPASERTTFVIEAGFETKRFEGGRADARLTIGVQVYGDRGRGGFRGAVGLPLNDGAPDGTLVLGAFLTY